MDDVLMILGGGGGWRGHVVCFSCMLQKTKNHTQDFWNVESSDPMFHLNSFFYGPMLKGRDGLGATPCAGTGVVFRRDVLTSIGGQSYGSITEDFNTAMHLLMSGFATMYVGGW